MAAIAQYADPDASRQVFREWLRDPSDLQVERPRKLMRLDDGTAAAATLKGPPATALTCAPWPPPLMRVWTTTMQESPASPLSTGAYDGMGADRS